MLPKEIYKKESVIINYLENLGIQTSSIKDTSLMLTAFVHKSYSYDFNKSVSNNERLEFVWDSILWAIIAKFLYQDFENYQESDLTLYKIALVREETLAEVANDIILDNMLFLWRGEEKTGGRKKKAILADALEGLIGYIYLDLGEKSVEEFIRKYVYSKLDQIKDLNVKSYKSCFQEIVQKFYKDLPEYKDTEYEIDDRSNVLLYKTEVFVLGERQWEWYGASKKKSQEEAAKNAFEKFQNIEE